MYNRITISSGHGLYVRGASGILDEVDEARFVVEALANELMNRGIDVAVYHDDVSQSQNENLNRIVDWHNSTPCDLALSIHFNAYEQVEKPMGTEVLYLTQNALAGQVSAAIASVGFINRGPKKRTDLFFLNNTAMPSILIEVCFVDSEADAEIYHTHFVEIVQHIADVLGGDEKVVPEPEAAFHAIGRASYFGGPDDTGVSPDEGLALHFDINPDNEHLFLPTQPEGTTGLARRLNARAVHYLACRWNYEVTSKDMLADSNNMALITNPITGMALTAWAVDWGPHEDTGRVADLSPALMEDLGIETDDEVEISFPYRSASPHE